MEKEENYYEILGIPTTATREEIKGAFRKHALQFHPDRNPGNKDAEDRFKKGNESYEILSDSDKRREYDNSRIPTAYDINMIRVVRIYAEMGNIAKLREIEINLIYSKKIREEAHKEILKYELNLVDRLVSEGNYRTLQGMSNDPTKDPEVRLRASNKIEEAFKIALKSYVEKEDTFELNAFACLSAGRLTEEFRTEAGKSLVQVYEKNNKWFEIFLLIRSRLVTEGTKKFIMERISEYAEGNFVYEWAREAYTTIMKANSLELSLREKVGKKLLKLITMKKDHTTPNQLMLLIEDLEVPKKIKEQAEQLLIDYCVETKNLKYLGWMVDSRDVSGESKKKAEYEFEKITIEKEIEEGDFQQLIAVRGDAQVDIELRNLAEEGIKTAIYNAGVSKKYKELAECEEVSKKLRIGYGVRLVEGSFNPIEQIDKNTIPGMYERTETIIGNNKLPEEVRTYALLKRIQHLIDLKTNWITPLLQSVLIAVSIIAVSLEHTLNAQIIRGCAYALVSIIGFGVSQKTGYVRYQKSSKLKELKKEAKEETPIEVSEAIAKVSGFVPRVRIFFGAKPRVLDEQMMEKYRSTVRSFEDKHNKPKTRKEKSKSAQKN